MRSDFRAGSRYVFSLKSKERLEKNLNNTVVDSGLSKNALMSFIQRLAAGARFVLTIKLRGIDELGYYF